MATRSTQATCPCVVEAAIPGEAMCPWPYTATTLVYITCPEM